MATWECLDCGVDGEGFAPECCVRCGVDLSPTRKGWREMVRDAVRVERRVKHICVCLGYDDDRISYESVSYDSGVIRVYRDVQDDDGDRETRPVDIPVEYLWISDEDIMEMEQVKQAAEEQQRQLRLRRQALDVARWRLKRLQSSVPEIAQVAAQIRELELALGETPTSVT